MTKRTTKVPDPTRPLGRWVTGAVIAMRSDSGFDSSADSSADSSSDSDSDSDSDSGDPGRWLTGAVIAMRSRLRLLPKM